MSDSSILRELLDYEPSSGIFKWRERASGRLPFNKVGARAGFLGPSGYRYIKFHRKSYSEHVLAYEITHGPVPNGIEIDHVNGIRVDNRIVNLRLATNQQNSANSKIRKNNKSGLKGAYRRNSNNGMCWQATITVKKKAIYLGIFSSKEEAHAAYLNAAKKHFGEFARAE